MKRLKLVFIIFSIIIIIAGDNSLLADDQILINNSGMVSQLPYGLKFFVHIKDKEQISDIAVKFRVLDRSAVQYDYLNLGKVEANNTIEYIFKTNSSKSYIPPGSLVEYYFEIFDSDNKSVKTDPIISRVLDARFKWESIKTENFEIFYHGPVKKRALRLLKASEELNIKMASVLSSAETDKIVLTMYNNNSEMYDAVVHKSSRQSRELITEGQAFDKENVVLVQGGGRRSIGTATHELTHILVARASKGSFLGVPLWLNEGLAEYGNLDPGTSYERFLEWAIDTERLIPFSSLNRFPGEPNLTIVAYGQSRSFVSFIIKEFGSGSIQEILNQLSEGKRIDGALEVVLGSDLNELENKWRDYIGAKRVEITDLEIRPKQGGSVPELKPYSLTPQPEDSSETLKEENKLEEDQIEEDQITNQLTGCNGTGSKSIDVSYLVLIGLFVIRYIARNFKLDFLPKIGF